MDREDTINRIENLTNQISELNAELESHEKEYDRISDLLEEEKSKSKENEDALKTIKDNMNELNTALEEKDKKINELENSDNEDSDEDSEGISEEVLFEYKEALRHIPREMRKQVSKTLAKLGLDEKKGTVDDDALDALLEEGRPKVRRVVQEHESEYANEVDDDNFDFQKIDRRISEVMTNGVKNQDNIAIDSDFDSNLSSVLDLNVLPTEKAESELSMSSQSQPRKSSHHRAGRLSRASSTMGKPLEQIDEVEAVVPNSTDQSSRDQPLVTSSTSAANVGNKLDGRQERPDSRMNISGRRNLTNIQTFTEEELQAMKEEGIRKAKLKRNILHLLPLLAPFVKPPKHSLRTVAIAVRFAVRFRRAIDSQDFRMMGSLGRKAEIKKVHEGYTKYAAIIEFFEKKVKIMEMEDANNKEQIEKMNETIKSLRKINTDLVAKSNLHEGDIEHLKRDVTRQHIIAQCQRNFAAELSDTLSILRNRLYLLIRYEGDIPVPLKEEDANKLEDKSIIRETTEEEDELERKRIQDRVNELFQKLRSHIMDVSHFVQENKKISPISTFALGRYPDFFSFGSKFRNELRNLQLFKHRALTGKPKQTVLNYMHGLLSQSFFLITCT